MKGKSAAARAADILVRDLGLSSLAAKLERAQAALRDVVRYSGALAYGSWETRHITAVDEAYNAIREAEGEQ